MTNDNELKLMDHDLKITVSFMEEILKNENIVLLELKIGKQKFQYEIEPKKAKNIGEALIAASENCLDKNTLMKDIKNTSMSKALKEVTQDNNVPESIRSAIKFNLYLQDEI